MRGFPDRDPNSANPYGFRIYRGRLCKCINEQGDLDPERVAAIDAYLDEIEQDNRQGEEE